MKLVVDDPGQRLRLEQVDPGFVIPPLRAVRSLTLDRLSGHVVLVESSQWGLLGRQRSLPLDQIDHVFLESSPRGRWREGASPPLQLTVQGAKGDRWEVGLLIDDLDRREELQDLALRIAAVAGLAAYRIDRKDDIGFGIQLYPVEKEGREPVPAVARAADYARDAVDGDRAVPEVAVPPFDAAGFKSAYAVERWEPGQRVVLRRPLGLAALGCAVLFLAAFGGIAALFVAGAIEAAGPEKYIFALIGAVAAVTVLGGLASAVRKSLPRSVTVDWAAGVLRVGRLLGAIEMPLDGLHELEVRGCKNVRPASRGTSGGVSYWCEVVAHGAVRGQTGMREVVLVDTFTLQGDPTGPVHAARPLAAELAAALGIEHRYTDYP